MNKHKLINNLKLCQLGDLFLVYGTVVNATLQIQSHTRIQSICQPQAVREMWFSREELGPLKGLQSKQGGISKGVRSFKIIICTKPDEDEHLLGQLRQ